MVALDEQLASHQQCGEESFIDVAGGGLVVARHQSSSLHESIACSLSHERNALA